MIDQGNAGAEQARNQNKSFLKLVLVLLLFIILASFLCGWFLSPTLPAFVSTRTATPTVTFTPSPLPPIYVTLNVNEFGTYTLYWQRDLWEEAIHENIFVEDFENDSGDYGELAFPYLTGNGLLLEGESTAQILSDDSLLRNGNLIHFRDWQAGLKFSFPNNSVVSALGFDYRSSETWQLAFNDAVISLPKGRSRFLGVVLHDSFSGDFVLLSSERVQGGLSVDNISYIPNANVTAVPASTSK